MMIRWLTLTWDVFKYKTIEENKKSATGLTLTWDVFKWKILIGISSKVHRLTLTWDVFKFYIYSITFTIFKD